MYTKSTKKTKIHLNNSSENTKLEVKLSEFGNKLSRELTQITDQLTAVMDHVSDALVIARTSGAVEYTNPVFKSLSGFSEDEVTTQDLNSCLPEIFHRGELNKEIDEKLRIDQSWQGTVSLIRKDKTVVRRPITISSLRLVDSSITYIMGVLHNQPVSDSSLEVIDEVCGLDRIGRLTSGVAHDINNHLSVIINYTYVLARHLRDNKQMSAHVQEVQMAAWRASRLSQQLLIFGRRNIDEPQILDINFAIRELSKLLCHILGDTIKIELELAPDLWPVNMALAQIEQILINLVIRRRDAMAGRGLLTINTENIEITKMDPDKKSSAKPGRYIQLSISDSGPLEKSFDRSETNQVLSSESICRALGLGYSMIIRTIRQVDGYLYIKSEDKGVTTFVVLLPIPNDESGDFIAPPGSILQFDNDK